MGIQTELSIRYGDPVAEILSFGGVQNADLVALSTHGRTGLERVRLGSVTESVLRRGKLPLLVYRSAGKFVPDPMHASKVRVRRLDPRVSVSNRQRRHGRTARGRKVADA
jgi:hypothetical protein